MKVKETHTNKIFYSRISLCFLLTYFFRLSKVWICVIYLFPIHDFLNLRQWANKLATKIACSWIKLRNAKDSLKYSLQLSPFYILFHPISLIWKRIPASLTNQDLLIFKMPGLKPGVKDGYTDVIYIAEIIQGQCYNLFPSVKHL